MFGREIVRLGAIRIDGVEFSVSRLFRQDIPRRTAFHLPSRMANLIPSAANRSTFGIG